MAWRKSTVQLFSLIYGIIFTFVGLAGFTAHGMPHETHLLFGAFPVNGLHNMAHLLIGLAGIAVHFGTPLAARTYAQVVGWLYLLLGFLGFVTPDLFGMMPIHGADIALHFLAAVVAMYFGYAPVAVTTRRPLPH